MGRELTKVPTVIVERIVVVDELEWRTEEGSGLVDVAAAKGDWKEPDIWSMLEKSKGETTSSRMKLPLRT